MTGMRSRDKIDSLKSIYLSRSDALEFLREAGA